MSLVKFIIFLSVALYWAIFCIYNTGSVSVHLPGLHDVGMPLSLFVFIIILCGACITTLLALTDQIHQWVYIKKLKKEINILEKNQINPDDRPEDGQQQ